jgi:hypothetical protein
VTTVPGLGNTDPCQTCGHQYQLHAGNTAGGFNQPGPDGRGFDTLDNTPVGCLVAGCACLEHWPRP